MGRSVLTGLAALGTLLAAPAAATAIVVSPETHASVRPGRIHPGTAVTVSFRQPTSTGLLPDARAVEVLRLSGPAHAGGCTHSVARTLAPAAAGTTVHRTVRPRPAGRARWCTGRFHGQITLAQSTRCGPGPIRDGIRACPMYVIAPRTIATFSFRVTAR